MCSEDSKYRFAFNELAAVILYDNVVNSNCWSRDDCEQTVNAVVSIIERMQKLIDKMEA